MAPQRTNENETPFGKWLERHDIDYAEAARELGVTRERVRQLAQKHYPSLVFGFSIKDWTRTVDTDDFVDFEDWRAVVMQSSETKAQVARPKRAEPPAPPTARPRKSKLRR